MAILSDIPVVAGKPEKTTPSISLWRAPLKLLKTINEQRPNRPSPQFFHRKWHRFRLHPRLKNPLPLRSHILILGIAYIITHPLAPSAPLQSPLRKETHSPSTTTPPSPASLPITLLTPSSLPAYYHHQTHILPTVPLLSAPQ